MEPLTHAELHARAKVLMTAWDVIPARADDAIITLGSAEASEIEHLCHEMAHALLLGIPLGPLLPRRITDCHPNYNNEVDAFKVVMGVLDLLEIDYSPRHMADECHVQVSGGYTKQELYERWSERSFDELAEQIANRILNAPIALP